MAIFGKSIRIYLKDGTVTGIKFGEVVNQTIQSISCPRLRIAELNEYQESKRPGVYFLFGQDEETNEPKAYIGEAENVYDRIQNHATNKEFWNEVIFFISKDENLTKSHVKYLESRLIQIANATKRYKTGNSNQPQLSSLPPSDRDAMEEFLVYLKLLLGVLGHKLLEELSNVIRRNDETLTNIDNPLLHVENVELFLSVAGVKAKALQTEEGIVVLENSELSEKVTTSLSFGYRELRDKLIANGDLKLVENKFIFQKNILFNSPSAAAAIIVGYSMNGPQNWKNKIGKSLKDIEIQRLNHKS